MRDKPSVSLPELFAEMFRLSAFTFGGGYVIVALMQSRLVEQKHWLDEKEMLNLTAIAQSAPGVVAVNAAIAVGYKLRGVAGLLLSVLATILPPFVIILMVCPVYAWMAQQAWISWLMLGMNVSVCAVIAKSVLDMARPVLKKQTVKNALILAGVFILSAFFQVNVIWIIAACLAAGALQAVFEHHQSAIKAGPGPSPDSFSGEKPAKELPGKSGKERNPQHAAHS